MVDRGKNEVNRRQFIARVGMAGAFLAGGGRQEVFTRRSAPLEKTKSHVRPNFILLVTDDQRWDAMGCMGNPIIRTPNMDRLASQGLLFTNNFCTTSICMCSRASIFTGTYTRRHQINTFQEPLSESALSRSYPCLLRKAGYRTGFVGKWGLGGALPKEGFDYFEGFSGQGQYFHTINGKTVHLTQLLAESALEFLRGCSKKQPFCLSVSFKSPHVQDGHPKPFRYDPAFEGLYRDVDIPMPKTAEPRFYKALPEFIRDSEGRTRWKRRFSTSEQFQESVKGYYRLITGVDSALGKIMAVLDEVGVNKNTVIIHTSDNGFFLGEHGLAGKWLMYEESIRIPLIIRDPRLPAKLQGRRCDEMTLSIDLAPTLFDLAGVPIPSAVQGRSLRPLLVGQATPWRDDWFYEHLYGHGGRIPKSEGVRTKRWKYVRYVGQEPPYEELYDLERDPYEEQNVAMLKDNEAVLARLRSRWRQLREALR